MKTLDRLNALIKQHQGHNDWYWVTWEPRHDYPSVGEVYRGYYLQCRIPGYTSEPGKWNWGEYVNGEWIGSNFKEARAHILEHVPIFDNAHWYERYKALRKEHSSTMMLLKDFAHWAHGVRMAIRLGELQPQNDYHKRDVELFEEYLDKAEDRVKAYFERDE